jgi:hypothetical protein
MYIPAEVAEGCTVGGSLRLVREPENLASKVLTMNGKQLVGNANMPTTANHCIRRVGDDIQRAADLLHNRLHGNGQKTNKAWLSPSDFLSFDQLQPNDPLTRQERP